MINKRLLLNTAIGGLLMAVANAAANAIPIVDVVNPEPNIEVSDTSREYIFTHDITDGIAPDIFVPATDIIESATISLNLADNGGSEKIVITIDELMTTTIDNIGHSYNYSAIIPSLSDLQLDGMLVIQLTTESRPSGIGNFFFADSTLTAQVTKGIPDSGPDNRNQVPEPTTFALLSLGLTGLGIARRKIKA